MINDAKRAKIKRFLDDEAMSTYVREAIQESFLKARTNKEIHYLAAKSLAVEFLDEAFKDLHRFYEDRPRESTEAKQIGL
jgi:hypothetical protein